MTEKLYYVDAYIKEFCATVLSVEAADNGFSVVLDRTAFFPNEGGQSSDTGRIGEVSVFDVRERDGVIYHLTDKAPLKGSTVECSLDFDARIDKMRQHTAEHIISGIINRLFGYTNVGFHLGDDIVTCDFDGELTDEEICETERLANLAIMENRSVQAEFPSPEELKNITYRSKLELYENVRLVRIDGVDLCACCAPHVRTTGEIGCVKILDCIRWRGGVRMTIAAGERALADYAKRHSSLKQISSLLSAPRDDVYEAVVRLKDAYESECHKGRGLMLRIAELEAALLPPSSSNSVAVLSDMTIPDLIDFSNKAIDKIGGILVALSGVDGSYKFVARSVNIDLRTVISEMKSTLSVKGGGNSGIVQGSINSTLEEIKKFFCE